MKLYSLKHHRNVERQMHFAVGQSLKTACGAVLFSRTAPVQLGSISDGTLATSNIEAVTCKNCLRMRGKKIKRLMEIEAAVPGVLNRPALCGETWLLKHALDIGQPVIEAQSLEIDALGRKAVLTPTMTARDRKTVLKRLATSTGK